MELQLRLPALTDTPAPSPTYYVDNLAESFAQTFADYSVIRKATSSGSNISAEIIFYHSNAIDSEIGEKFARADFFWSELQRLCKKHYSHVLKDVLKSESELSIHDFIIRVIIPFHVAFHNNYIEKGDKFRQRAEFHFENIRSAVSLTNSLETRTDVYFLLVNQRIRQYKEQEKWNEVIKAGEQLMTLGMANAELWDSMTHAYVHDAYARIDLNKEGESAHLDNAAKFREVIDKLLLMHIRMPRISVYDALGQLYHQESLQLAFGRSFAAALKASYYATAWDNNLEDALNLQPTLIDSIKKIQANVAAVEAQIRATPNMHLTAEGLKMKIEATSGVKAVEDLLKSGELEKITNARRNAEAQLFWESIGMAEEGDWIDRSQQLYTMMQRMQDQSVSINDAVEQLIEKMGVDFPVDKAINYWMKNERYTKPPEGPALYAPIITTNASNEPDRPPLLLWWKSPYDRMVKIQLVAAAVLFLVLTTFTIIETTRLSRRNEGFKQVIAGIEKKDNKEVIDGGRKFLANTPLILNDERIETVKNYYEDRVARYVLENRHVITSEEVEKLF